MYKFKLNVCLYEKNVDFPVYFIPSNEQNNIFYQFVFLPIYKKLLYVRKTFP